MPQIPAVGLVEEAMVLQVPLEEVSHAKVSEALPHDRPVAEIL
jgi:hypothetical protein